MVPSTLETWVNANDLGALGEQLAERRTVRAVEVEPSLVGDADPAQRRAGAPGELLPRHEVGVVLHLGDEDLVALTEVESRVLRLSCNGVREGVGHQVERLGGVLGEHHLLVRSPDEPRDLGPRALVGVGGLLAELVRSAVHGTVDLLAERALGVERTGIPLRGGTGVEVDQWLPVTHGARQDREAGPDRGPAPRR